MTTPAILALEARMHAIVTRVEGMKAANLKWAFHGGAPEYDESAFEIQAGELQQIADDCENLRRRS